MEKIVFLPGASGNLDFWKPLIEFLPEKYEKQIIGYPGFGNIAEDTSLKNFSDLEEYVTGKINSESILIAQSMGGIFAVNKAFTDAIVKLLYYPYRIRKKLEIIHRLSRSTILYAYV